MKTAYLLDTNVILRLILKDNPSQHAQIIELLEKAETGVAKLFCSTISIFEVIFVLLGKTYQTPKTQVVAILQTILDLKVINFENEDALLLALEMFLANSLSFADNYLLAKAKIAKQVFFSFDQKALKVYQGLKS